MAALKQMKQTLRRELKKRLAGMSETERKRQSECITQKLIKHPKYEASRRISVYLSMTEEVNTLGILQHIFDSNKVCFVPQYIGNNMDMLKLNSMQDYDALPKTKWNIKQPTDSDNREEALSTGGLDMIIIPGLGFTRDGKRLGRGKGYYDNYQSRCVDHSPSKPYTIALAFQEQICDDIPVSDHDVNIDEVLVGDMDITG
ncbi:5-formyltetrahydrofolate cyclo-ligase-like [Saccoglossus kowalevskii]|uniref:5-formyltetrahydrofolate cyclo-ligase n=1 Tax=Saccoglossus kowalevskii TaxID=10224 RepID=A0ABM0GZ95_SACKO|nr:PREDICTED: 5-formyltetrahydrofolate cyclo-ligase-like [Saccoglossus kowalevskii]